MDIRNFFTLVQKEHEEYLQFERVKEKFSQRADLHAFILLDKIIPGDRDIICGAEHDEYFISIDLDELERNATEEQLIDLVRCGLLYSAKHDYLYFFA